MERYLRESFIPRMAPVSRELVLCHVAGEGARSSQIVLIR